jgi:insertion element IS1 protein InsB
VLEQLNPETVEIDIRLLRPIEELDEWESELDEMWSYVGKKDNPRWLWYGIEHRSGKVLAYVFGRRKDEVFLQLKALLEPFGISRFYTDGWGAYERHLEAQQHEVSKQNMQKIESKHTNLRARIKRLARRTIYFSKTAIMHDIVIGLFINRYEFGVSV